MRNTILLYPILLTQLASAQDLRDCTAFSSNGVAASQYQYYRFYDFRQMKSAGHGHSNTKGLQSKVVSDSSWKNDWYIRDYPRKSPGGYSIPVNFIPERVFISTFPYFPTRKTAAQQTTANATDPSTNSTSHLSLNTARIDSETQDSGEILFKEFNISYASLRVYSRVHGAPGAVAGIFTYLNDTQESDIEIFTRAPSTFIQYSNQPASSGEPDWAPIPGATVNVSLSSGQVYTDWHVQRLDWTPERSVFFVDGEMMNQTDLHVPVPSPPSGFYVDMWSANSTWSGSMEVGRNATLDVLWIEMLFNTTQGIQKSGASRVCAVSEGKVAAVQQSSAVTVVWPLRMGWVALMVSIYLLA
jgi:hypothetical protein